MLNASEIAREFDEKLPVLGATSINGTKVHIVLKIDGINKTLCGRRLNETWFAIPKPRNVPSKWPCLHCGRLIERLLYRYYEHRIKS